MAADREKPADEKPDDGHTAAAHAADREKPEDEKPDDGHTAAGRPKFAVPTTAGRITFPNGAKIRVDPSNHRFYGYTCGGIVVREVWGGRKKGYPRLTEAWERACEWCGVEPYGEATRDAVISQQQALLGGVRTPSDALTLMSRRRGKFLPAAADAPVWLEVEEGMRERPFDLSGDTAVGDLLEAEGWPSDCLVDKRYTAMKPWIQTNCVFKLRGESHCWAEEILVSVPNGSQVLGIVCNVCRSTKIPCDPGPRAVFVSIPKITNHDRRIYLGHARSRFHMRALGLLGACSGPLDRFAVTVPVTLDDSTAIPITRQQLFLFVSTYQQYGSDADFGKRMEEQFVLQGGRFGAVTGQSYKALSAKFVQAVDDTIESDFKLLTSGVRSACLSADEPRGVDRVGLRTTFVPTSLAAVYRKFYKLAELTPFTDPGGVQHAPRTAQSLFVTIRREMSAVMDFQCLDKFTPDGASVFGAAAAEAEEGCPQFGQNVAHIWNEFRLQQGWDGLTTCHCSGHRASLANKDSRTSWVHDWQRLIERQYYYFHESAASLLELHRTQDDLLLPRATPMRGSAQKWIGFHEPQQQQLEQWAALSTFWSHRFANLPPGSENRDLAMSCADFYSTMKNRFLAAGNADIDMEQFLACSTLQDTHTPLARVPQIVEKIVTRLCSMFFGSKEAAPLLLTPSANPCFWTQRLLQCLSTQGDVVSRDLNPKVLDECWQSLRERAAGCMAAWTRRFPDRELVSAMSVLDPTTNWGDELPVVGPNSISSCFEVLAVHFSSTSQRLQRAHTVMTCWLRSVDARPETLTGSAAEELLLRYLRLNEEECPVDSPWGRVVLWQLIMQKTSASLERDFKAMRSLMSASGPKLSHESLNRRLRLLLNTPDVLCGSPESGAFLRRCEERLSQLETDMPSTSGGRKRGRPCLARVGRDMTGAPFRPKKKGKAVVRGRVYSLTCKNDAARIKGALVDLTSDDPEAMVHAIQGVVPEPSMPISTLLASAKDAAIARAAAVEEANRAYATTVEGKKRADAAKLPALPKVVAKKTQLTTKDAVRYISMLLAPLGKPSSDFRINVKKFTTSFVAKVHERDSAHVGRNLLAEVRGLDGLTSLHDRVAWALAKQKEMGKASIAELSEGTLSSSSTD